MFNVHSVANMYQLHRPDTSISGFSPLVRCQVHCLLYVCNRQSSIGPQKTRSSLRKASTAVHCGAADTHLFTWLLKEKGATCSGKSPALLCKLHFWLPCGSAVTFSLQGLLQTCKPLVLHVCFATQIACTGASALRSFQHYCLLETGTDRFACFT